MKKFPRVIREDVEDYPIRIEFDDDMEWIGVTEEEAKMLLERLKKFFKEKKEK